MIDYDDDAQEQVTHNKSKCAKDAWCCLTSQESSASEWAHKFDEFRKNPENNEDEFELPLWDWVDELLETKMVSGPSAT